MHYYRFDEGRGSLITDVDVRGTLPVTLFGGPIWIASGVPLAIAGPAPVLEAAAPRAVVTIAETCGTALTGGHIVCRPLMTVPGIGMLTTLRFVAAINEPGRFATAHHV